MRRLLAWLSTKPNTAKFLRASVDEPYERKLARAAILEIVPASVLLFLAALHGVQVVPIADALDNLPYIGDQVGTGVDKVLTPGTSSTTVVNNLNIPASPVDIKPEDVANVACHAQRIEKAQVNLQAPPVYTYTGKHTTLDGRSAFIRWTDAPGMLGETATLEVNGVPAYPTVPNEARDCLRARGVPSPPALGGPR